jgi:hypothetical protein
MNYNFSTSNLSKIKTKFRTSGNISQPRRKAGSPLTDIGVSHKKVVRVVHPEAYLARLYDAFDKTSDPKMKEFLYTQIRDKLIQSNRWHP